MSPTSYLLLYPAILFGKDTLFKMLYPNKKLFFWEVFSMC
jgi:hypothetical protein